MSINESTIKGKYNEGAGKLKQSVGELTHNNKVANAGTAQQLKGQAEQAWGSVKEAVHDAKERNRPEAEQHAHDVREKLTTSAANAKEHIQETVKK